MKIHRFDDFVNENAVVYNNESVVTVGHIVNYLRSKYSKETPIFTYDGEEGLCNIKSNLNEFFKEQNIYEYTSNDYTTYSPYELDPTGQGYLVDNGKRYFPPKPKIIKGLVIH